MTGTSKNLAHACVALVLILGCVVFPSAAGAREPEVDARAWALVDLRSGELLAGEEASTRLPMGSTDKIMVAVVAMRLVGSGEASLGEEVVVSDDAAAYAIPLYSNVGLFAGDALSVRELLAATLISSGNDAAYALAEHLGGEGGVEGFVALMNEEAETLGLRDTRFQNPTGLDARGQYSSAHDLAAMARAASGYPVFREMVATNYAVITTRDREIELASTNELLSTYPRATGVKTGTTPRAGESLVASAVWRDEAYVSVVLDAREDRFAASVRALEYGFSAYDRANLVQGGEEYARADVPYRRGETVGLVARESVEGLVGEDPEIERTTRVFENPPDSTGPGTPLGEIVVEVDGEWVGDTALVAETGYDEASLWERAWFTTSGVLR